jgi:ABC-type transport system involved in cytochrome c biogenesis permease subunit
MKISKTLVLMAVVAALGLPAPDAAAKISDELAQEALGTVLIQDQGRIKPLDTFARNHLLALRHKSSASGRPAIAWLAELLIDPVESFKVPVVRLLNPEVVDALSLPLNDKRVYSLEEVAAALAKIEPDLRALSKRDAADRTLVDRQLLELYQAVAQTMELSRSLTGLLPTLTIDSLVLAQELGLPANEKLSYLAFARKADQVEQVLRKYGSAPGEVGQAAQRLAAALSERLADSRSSVFAILPPGSADPTGSRWHSPWALLAEAPLEADQDALLTSLEGIVQGLLSGDEAAVRSHVATYQQLEATRLGSAARPAAVATEMSYNRTAPFEKSAALYVLSLLLLMGSWMVWRKGLWRAAMVAAGLGLLIHTAGIVMRTVIMARPPVSNMYETVIFTGFIAALAGLIVELARKDGLGIFVAVTVGAALHFIGFSYASDGDTMGMLVAVLDSNFWLATHVITITVGYGAAVAAAVLGHVYLVHAAVRPGEASKLRTTARNMLGLTLIALLFTTLGTILGGIWADQSWGRFWGWDPKENGALLIVMWLLLLVHGRRTGHVEAPELGAGLVLTNIVVAAAWFGVNLLNVGLHSYGFTDSIAMNLAIFCGAEALFVGIMYPIVLARRSQATKAHLQRPAASHS